LQRLVTLQGPYPGEIRDLARQALKRGYAKPIYFQADARAVLAKLPLYPTGHTLDADLSQSLQADWGRRFPWVGTKNVAQTTAGVFIDLKGDGTDEFVLMSAYGGPVYQNRGGHWQYVGALSTAGMPAPWPVLVKALSGGDIAAGVPAWKDLTVGIHLYRMNTLIR
jgi:hypothetical protein